MTEQNPNNELQSEADALPTVLQQSICSGCVERKIVRSGKGSVFLLCQVGIANQSWPKYPPQPVERCPKFCADKVGQ
jgi:hypothetical protein